MKSPSRQSSDPTICDCECHKKDSRIMHIVPCCFECPACGENIKVSIYTKQLDIHGNFCKKKK